MIEAKMSVRARHKQETISLIHTIAENSALINGLSDTKIEDIAIAAGISKRTFFNYFPTKEDAVLGLQASYLPDGAIERFSTSLDDDVLTRTTNLVMEVTRTASIPGSSAKRRKELRQRFPELTQRFEIRAAAAGKIVRPIITDYLSRSKSDVASDEIDIILSLAGVIIRHAYSIDPEITDANITKSINLFKTTIRKRL